MRDPSVDLVCPCHLFLFSSLSPRCISHCYQEGRKLSVPLPNSMPNPVMLKTAPKHQQQHPCMELLLAPNFFAQSSLPVIRCSRYADGTVLLYDPRKLVTPWDQTTCSGSHVIKDLHWQHTSSSKSSRTAVKAGSQDSHAARTSAEQNGATTSARDMQAHAAPVFATPAPAPHAAVSPHMLVPFLDHDIFPLLLLKL